MEDDDEEENTEIPRGNAETKKYSSKSGSFRVLNDVPDDDPAGGGTTALSISVGVFLFSATILMWIF